MSIVTEIMIIYNWDETEAHQELQAWLTCNGQGELAEMDMTKAGGNKYFTADVFAGAYNHFPVERFFEFVRHHNWKGDTPPTILISHDPMRDGDFVQISGSPPWK